MGQALHHTLVLVGRDTFSSQRMSVDLGLRVERT